MSTMRVACPTHLVPLGVSILIILAKVKVKLSLCLTKHETMKVNGGVEIYRLRQRNG